ncbi:MAG TPA: cation-translocating P-type ATPase [Atribacteraceae bacterium]|nr:cation-translocating P-type ATPase [Atribacteraceae bacterium]
MWDFHCLTTEDTMKVLAVSDQGLSNREVVQRREKYGMNELLETVKESVLQTFLNQFKDLLVLILLAAAVISAFLGKFDSAVVIIIVVLLNATLGTLQHVKAEHALQGLKKLSEPVAEVLRDDKRFEIASRELVPGDILYLDAGDYVSADSRILESHSLQVNESSLTGESISVSKVTEPIQQADVAIGDRKNMVFSGSYVTYGRAVVVVTQIGMNTEIGKVAHLLETAQENKTPLQVSLEEFGRKLAIVVLAISALVFGLNLFHGRELITSFLFAVSLAVAAIPEALSSIVTIVLALGTQRMAKKNAIVRKLYAIESLGCITVICSDKTGTLTQNKMTVRKAYVDETVLESTKLNPDKELEKKLVLIALLCNDAVTFEQKEMGDPTEVALVNLGEMYGLDELAIRKEYPHVGEIPFDSNRKLMSTVNRVKDKTFLITKGAVDTMLSRIKRIDTSDGVKLLTQDHVDEIKRNNSEFAENGLRVLAFAFKEVSEETIRFEDETDLTFIGLIAMMDPPRPETAGAVASCIQAGIRPVMITGDHKTTASTIARQIGILTGEFGAMEGSELEKLTNEELQKRVTDISVFARVSPEHKIRIVGAWQQRGDVIAMTGDGVNDAPALKQADIGIAMGITGTEVAKEAAVMVLADDNFSTIVDVISTGRSIFANIKNAIKFLLGGNTAGILSVLYASLLGLPVPFTPIHLLFINLITDSLPAIAIGLEPHNPLLMQEKPRNIKVPILNKKFATEIISEGLLIALSTMTAFHLGLAGGNPHIASTMAFATLSLSRLIHGFNSRSKTSIFKIGVFTNRILWVAILLGYLLLRVVLTFPPAMQIFEVAPRLPISIRWYLCFLSFRWWSSKRLNYSS